MPDTEPLDAEYIAPETEEETETSNVILVTGFKIKAVCIPMRCDNCNEDVLMPLCPIFCPSCGIDFRDENGKLQVDDEDYPLESLN